MLALRKQILGDKPRVRIEYYASNGLWYVFFDEDKQFDTAPLQYVCFHTLHSLIDFVNTNIDFDYETKKK